MFLIIIFIGKLSHKYYDLITHTCLALRHSSNIISSHSFWNYLVHRTPSGTVLYNVIVLKAKWFGGY